MKLSAENDQLIFDLVEDINLLRQFIKDTGRENSSAWIALNLRLQTTHQQAVPYLARHALMLIDGPLLV